MPGRRKYFFTVPPSVSYGHKYKNRRKHVLDGMLLIKKNIITRLFCAFSSSGSRFLGKNNYFRPTMGAGNLKGHRAGAKINEATFGAICPTSNAYNRRESNLRNYPRISFVSWLWSTPTCSCKAEDPGFGQTLRPNCVLCGPIDWRFFIVKNQ